MSERKRPSSGDIRRAKRKRKRRDGEESRVSLYPDLPFIELFENLRST